MDGAWGEERAEVIYPMGTPGVLKPAGLWI